MGKLDVLKEALKDTKKDTPVPATKADKFAALKAVEKDLNKDFDTDSSVILLGDKKGIPIPCISTDIPSIDLELIQAGGIPRGRIVEIIGVEGGGKTTLCLQIIAQEQKNTENLAAFIDAEHSLDITYAAQLGVNVDELIVSQPSCGEEALTTAEKLIDNKIVSLIVIDSVAALVPRSELDGEMGEAQMGVQARLMGQALRKLIGKCRKNNVTIIFTNQIREKLGVTWGSNETTPGGRALKFYASLRLDVRRVSQIKSGEEIIGQLTKIKGIKNKVGSPYREVEVRLIYGKGLDKFSDVINWAVKLNIVEKSGAWYSFEGERIGQGIDNTSEFLRNNQQLFDKMCVSIKERSKQTPENL